MNKQKYYITIIYQHTHESIVLGLLKKLQVSDSQKIKKEKLSLKSEPNNTYIKQVIFIYLSFSEYNTAQKLLIIESQKNIFHYIIKLEVTAKADKKLLFMDVDSTLIEQEVIDEIAKSTSTKKEVEHITKEAMQGKLGFEEALNKRMQLIQGVHQDTLKEIQENLIITLGFKELLDYCKQHTIKVGIASGGFTYFTNYLHQKFSLDFSFANQLEIGQNGKITNKLLKPIITKEKKKMLFLKKLQEYSLKPEESIVIGDGANDIEVLKEAGIAIAFCAKKTVIESGNAAINKRNLEISIHLL